MIKETRLIMGMPIVLMTPDQSVTNDNIEEVFSFFSYVDKVYSPFIESSIVSRIDRGEIGEPEYPRELRAILAIAKSTKRETNGYFNVWHKGNFDPSGIVKGWAIARAAEIFSKYADNFYVEAGGDIQVSGMNETGGLWQVGIRSPFDRRQNIKVVALKNSAIATSGTVIRGQHIYNPIDNKKLDKVASITVIASNIIDADRMATAAFAMGEKGIYFIEQLDGYEGCAVMHDKTTITTTGWGHYEVKK
jgi:thiamine biosynthesis lipoprotein